MSALTSLEVCSGAGGQALGLERVGFHHAALVEIEPPACMTLRLNRPKWNVVEGDLRLFSGAAFVDDRATLIWSLAPLSPPWDLALELFSRERLDQSERLSLLSGRSDRSSATDGPLVCSCFSVGQKTIEAAIAQGCRSTVDVGKAVRAGSNCGSCRPEIERLIKASSAAASPTAEQHA